MRQSEENIRKIEDAAISGKYQIVCRQVFGSLNSWYITNNPITEWNWGFNEYRIYVGCNEPPMTNKMNDYSVYYCGYNYYFLEGGVVKKQVNVNVAQDCESAPYFKSNHILSDKITPLENGNVEIENLRADGLKANEIFTDKVTSLKGDTVSIGQNLTVEGNLTVKGDTKQVNTVLETLNYKRIEVNSTGEVSLSSADTDSILVGAKTSTNLGIDANEIQARNNGSASTLYLNPQGGNVEIKSLVVKGDSTIPGYATTTEVNAKYTKPSTGIPKTDLASAVQTSLGKADTALQSHQDISGKADKKDIPTKTSQLTNDSGFLTKIGSHTHTKSQITDFPTSLPANGGTATKATQDGDGNNIADTYAKKSEISVIKTFTSIPNLFTYLKDKVTQGKTFYGSCNGTLTYNGTKYFLGNFSFSYSSSTAYTFYFYYNHGADSRFAVTQNTVGIYSNFKIMFFEAF